MDEDKPTPAKLAATILGVNFVSDARALEVLRDEVLKANSEISELITRLQSVELRAGELALSKESDQDDEMDTAECTGCEYAGRPICDTCAHNKKSRRPV